MLQLCQVLTEFHYVGCELHFFPRFLRFVVLLFGRPENIEKLQFLQFLPLQILLHEGGYISDLLHASEVVQLLQFFVEGLEGDEEGEGVELEEILNHGDGLDCGSQIFEEVDEFFEVGGAAVEVFVVGVAFGLDEFGEDFRIIVIDLH